MEQVFLARHGETEWNRIRRRQGQLNSPLTAEGLAGAHRIAALVATLPIDSVLSSPLGRASETASVVLPLGPGRGIATPSAKMYAAITRVSSEAVISCSNHEGTGLEALSSSTGRVPASSLANPHQASSRG
ncbi:MAG: histidine phosphatase family protein [Actinobacteria bacterium]|nr:histidine phosphatase family protein [Actinomycetota bacterium]